MGSLQKDIDYRYIYCRIMVVERTRGVNMTATKQAALKHSSMKIRAMIRLAKARMDKMERDGNKTAIWLRKHPKITRWLMKKSPQMALAITAILWAFHPNGKLEAKKQNNQITNKQNKRIMADVYKKLARERD